MSALYPERMAKLAGSMREALQLLAELRDIPEDVFLSDKHRQSSAKYNFTIAIEAAIDMANHIISRDRLRTPEDYVDTFQVLTEAGAVPQDFADELKKMARFRNRLVHLYWSVDVSEIRRILVARLGDFDRFLSCVGQRMKADM